MATFEFSERNFSGRTVLDILQSVPIATPSPETGDSETGDSETGDS
ncbi:MAG: hypothetical protein RIS70_732 [Planctomycetota bacterium]